MTDDRPDPIAGSARLRLLLVLAALLATAALTAADVLWRMDLWLYDQTLHLRAWDDDPDPRIVIVGIDEASLAKLGRWPWPRALHAEAVRRLTAAGVRGIGYIVLFAEGDGIDPGGDAELVGAVRESGGVVLPAAAEPQRLGGPLIEVLPMSDLAVAARTLGHVDVPQDGDGLTRGIFLRAGLGEAHWSTLALALTEGRERTPADALPGLRTAVPESASPYHWVRDHYVLLPYAGPPGTFGRISFIDLLEGAVPDDLLRDRWILIGMTALGYGDGVATPLDGGREHMPGVEFNAHVLKTLLDQAAITPLSTPARLAIGAAFVLLPFALLALPVLGNATAAAAIAFVLLCATTLALLFGAHLWLPPSVPLLVLAVFVPLWLLGRMRRWQFMANRDALTGLANRYRFDRFLRREWQAARRSGQPLALLLVDVDHFKPFNDRYGHASGDDALRMVARVLAAGARRPRDLAARYGGEEFALILPDTDAEGARRVAERIRADVAALGIAHQDSPHGQRVTVSVGVHACTPAGDEPPKRLFAGADAALYRAKELGRHRVCLHVPDPSDPARPKARS